MIFSIVLGGVGFLVFFLLFAVLLECSELLAFAFIILVIGGIAGADYHTSSNSSEVTVEVTIGNQQ